MYVPTLFFADDGLLMATEVQEMEQIIPVLMEAAERAGMKTNIEN